MTLALGHLQLDRLIRVSRRHIRVLDLQGLVVETTKGPNLPHDHPDQPAFEADCRQL